MRVISGKYKGRKLVSPPDDRIRPTNDRVKEAIFGKLQFQMSGAKFLDLFSGSGSIGIEAMSRGASTVYFNDIDKKSISIINSNLEKIQASGEVISYDYKDTIKLLKEKEVDFIFVDAPYAVDCIANVMRLAYENNTLAVGGTIVYEHNDNFELSIDEEHYELTDNKKYGKTFITYIKRIK